MLQFTDVSVEYANGTIALKNFNLEINKGEIISLVGESGSGKTTSIRAAIGLLPIGGKISNGDISLNDKSISNLNSKQWQKIRGYEMSMIFQDCGSMLNPIRTIGSQFIEYIRTHEKISKKEAYEKSVSILEDMGLYDGNAIMKSIPSQLSGGMRQRVGIAMAMIFKPQLILADEPTSALDVTIQAQIVRQLMELREQFNTSIIMVTHNLGVAAYMSDKIVVMKDGLIVEVGTRDEILLNPKHKYTKKLIAAIPDINADSDLKKGVCYA